MWAWVEGSVQPLQEARISLADHGLLYGDSLYETLRTFGGRLYRLPEHLRRLRATARGLRIPVPWSDQELEGWIADLRRHLPGRDHYLRLLVTRGPGDLSYAHDPGQHPTLLILGGEIQALPREVQEMGLTAVTVDVPRSVPNPLLPGLKTGNLLNSRLAFMEARERGADEAVMLNRAGYLAEGALANLFLVLPGPVLATPSLDSEILEGVTRSTLLDLARTLGYAVREELLPAHLLLEAEEAFLSSTTRSVAPLRSLDGRPLACPGPVTLHLMDAFVEAAGGL